MQIQDKIIVVTGAASGIGRALAVRFEEEGARKIVAVDINETGAKETADRIGGTAMVADVSVEADLRL